MLKELAAYVPPGSEALVIGEKLPREGSSPGVRAFDKLEVTLREGDITARDLLESLELKTFDRVLLQSETEGRDASAADARTLISLLHLRDLTRTGGLTLPIASELLEVENRELATVSEADDSIVSNTMISLLMSQVSENRHLFKIFEELFDPEGSELYLKPVGRYVPTGVAVDFDSVVAAAAKHGEVALGYRAMSEARDASRAHGIHVNPRKSETVVFQPEDRIVVLAES